MFSKNIIFYFNTSGIFLSFSSKATGYGRLFPFLPSEKDAENCVFTESWDATERINGSSRIHSPCIYHHCHVALAYGGHYGLAAAVEPHGYLRVRNRVLLPC